MLITDCPGIARHAVECGVDRIFVDLETIGKRERQGHLDSHISAARFEDIARIRAAIGNRTPLLVRLNPPNRDSAVEVERALAAGADLLMLPYFESAGEVASFCRYVAGRVPVIPLIETAAAAEATAAIIQVRGVDEIYVGLNDLHLSLGQTFMFAPLADGTVERIAAIAREAHVPFGFGGMARIGQGELKAEMILAEHLRLGSSSVILSRGFHGKSRSLDELRTNIDLAAEIAALRRTERALEMRSAEQVANDRGALVSRVAEIIARSR